MSVPPPAGSEIRSEFRHSSRRGLVPLWLLFLFLFLPEAPRAQGLPKVEASARFRPASAAPGTVVELRIEARIQQGYHIYGPGETQNTPTSLEFKDHPRLEAVGDPVFPTGKPHLDPFGNSSVWIEGTVVFVQRFRVRPGTGPGGLALAGFLHYAPCTENYCEPEESAGFEAKLEVLAPPSGKDPSGKEAGKAGSAGKTEPKAEAAGQDPGKGAKRRDPAAEGPDPTPEDPASKVFILSSAFAPPSVRPGERVRLTLRLRTRKGWHVYGAKEEFGEVPSFDLETPAWLKAAGPISVPEGEPHDLGGGLRSYWVRGDFELSREYVVDSSAPAGKHEIAGILSFLPCTEDFCLETGELDFKGTLEIGSGEEGGEAEGASGNGTPDPRVPNPRVPSAGPERSKPGSLWLLVLAAISAGLLALLMPCTYPMIPITFSFFTKQAQERGGSTLGLALVYGSGIILIFIAIGVVVGGAIVGFAVHWATNLVVGLLFLLFALSLFGVIALRPPRFLLDAAGKASMKRGYLGVFLMGATLVVTSFTCTVPFVASLLGASAAGGLGHVVLGMGVFGATMAIPFVILALIPGKLKDIPSAGEWMHVLKVFLGFVEVAAALKFFSNVDLNLQLGLLPDELFLTMWFGIFLAAACFLFGMIRMEGDSGEIGPGRLVGGVAVLMLALYFGYGALGNPYRNNTVMNGLLPGYGADEFLGYASAGGGGSGNGPSSDGNGNGGIPANGGGRRGGGGSSRVAHPLVVDDFEEALARAKEQGRLLLVNFTGFT